MSIPPCATLTTGRRPFAQVSTQCTLRTLSCPIGRGNIHNSYCTDLSMAPAPQAIRTRVLDFPNLSPEAADFLHSALTRDPATRPSAKQLLSHPWIVRHCGVVGSSAGSPTALHLPAPPLPPPPAAPQLPGDAQAAGPGGVQQNEGADGVSGSPAQQVGGAAQRQQEQLEQPQQQVAEPASGQSWHQSADSGAGGSGEHHGPVGQAASQTQSHQQQAQGQQQQ